LREETGTRETMDRTWERAREAQVLPAEEERFVVGMGKESRGTGTGTGTDTGEGRRERSRKKRERKTWRRESRVRRRRSVAPTLKGRRSKAAAAALAKEAREDLAPCLCIWK
jgi:hypothetical protein